MTTRSAVKRKREDVVAELGLSLKSLFAAKDVLSGASKIIFHDLGEAGLITLNEFLSILSKIDETTEKRDTLLTGICRTLELVVEFFEKNRRLASIIDAPKEN